MQLKPGIIETNLNGSVLSYQEDLDLTMFQKLEDGRISLIVVSNGLFIHRPLPKHMRDELRSFLTEEKLED